MLLNNIFCVYFNKFIRLFKCLIGYDDGLLKYINGFDVRKRC